VTGQQNNLTLDEQTLARLLEAAYVLQEHNRERGEIEASPQRNALQVVGSVDHEGEEDVPPQASAGGPFQSSSEVRPQASAVASVQSNQDEQARPHSSHGDYTHALEQIVETQHQIQTRPLEFENALRLIVDRLLAITKADGAAIGVLDGEKLCYRAVSGTPALPLGSEVSIEKALAFACLRTGEVFRCSDVAPELAVDAGECHRRGIQSFIVVPIHHESGVAGALELYSGRTHAFGEQDVHTCQLVAGLVTEAFARNSELVLRKSVASERATMLHALEVLKPNLTSLAQAQEPSVKISQAQTTSSTGNVACRKCGHNLAALEHFCGNCGAPRSDDYVSPSMQSKVATLLRMQSVTKDTAGTPSNGRAPESASASSADSHGENALPMGQQQSNSNLPLEMSSFPGESESELSATQPATIPETDALIGPVEQLEQYENDLQADEVEAVDEHPDSPATTALTNFDESMIWTSAANARGFLEELAADQGHSRYRRFWNSRRGDIYLVVAVILFAIALRWAIWSNHSVGAGAATHHRRADPNADLSLFDRMLIGLGIAEAPDPPPEPTGNPDTQVWEDLHSALYYCPGTDLYGKTPTGKFASQREAQLDQFEPAYRKTCK
jgi:GAF domain-containing protein